LLTPSRNIYDPGPVTFISPRKCGSNLGAGGFGAPSANPEAVLPNASDQHVHDGCTLLGRDALQSLSRVAEKPQTLMPIYVSKSLGREFKGFGRRVQYKYRL
jgi:hypothetical protein